MSNDNKNKILFKMHPRVFAALGADLVTNDVVAVIELVKNSYDAFAENVWIRFDEDDNGKKYVEIEDDGSGMTRDIIENVWCVVATPYRKDNPYAVLGNKKRRVSGEKGLGRLSVARLGEELEMYTKFRDESCLQIDVNWGSLATANDMDQCYVSCVEYKGTPLFKDTGTLIRIYGLKSSWDDSMLKNLKENLARLISPFADLGDFNIFIHGGLGAHDYKAKIEAPRFLFNPKYRIKGSYKDNLLSSKYDFLVIQDSKGEESSEREVKLDYSWQKIYNKLDEDKQSDLDENETSCGPFDFEIRAWDIDAGGTEEISENFGVQKTLVRKAISTHKGVSVYRDGILVLPKSETARDWLGLDLRRISKVGDRLSTSQLVGHVAITADENPNISDTSDRERLAATKEVTEFEEIIITAIKLLENERDQDRVKPEREKPLESLFEKLTAETLMAEVSLLAEKGATAKETMPIVKVFNKSLDAARKTIQERFIYYSRMATVGTISQILIHEILNRTNVLGAFIGRVKESCKDMTEKSRKSLASADNAIRSLERLADTFLPLANRSFRRKKRDSNLFEKINECIELQGNDIKKYKIDTFVDESVKVDIAVDPGELDAILINLISNATYWLSDIKSRERRIEFKAHKISNNNRVRITVDDSGPGIRDDIVDKVMWPGVTLKPEGIGMGLTVASELVSEYGGQMRVKHPGTLGGASFVFDLPLKR